MNNTYANTKRLSLSAIAPSTSTSSGLANRRAKRNNKNLSLCLTPEATKSLFAEPIKTATIQQKDNLNAYPLGPAKIMPYLYLGNEKNTLDLDHLKYLNIQAILNVAAEVNNPYDHLFQSMDDMVSREVTPSPSLSKASSISTVSSISTLNDCPINETVIAYQKLPWEHHQDNLVHELAKAIDIIDRARSAGQNVLVHCQCGVARSATVIIAYVMKTLKMPMQEAYDHVKNLAPAINPNLSLLFQLREFEQQLNQPENNGFLSRASSICKSGTWKRKLSKSIFTQQPQDHQIEWWKSKKVSLDLNENNSSVCY
ncbi:hypothetical protein CU098_011186 [Rhizopus stolonifer]|uniref:protein-tyrosine-phosphatase n=1 Tax=Rhizopus stolonifer TaxID=4846 RepID=A0A367KUF3_RHIST|nr:hypothetical protein CU098_011186 [Rhizopus stolonifer]